MASSKGAPNSVALLLFFVFWYAGNMKYNEYLSLIHISEPTRRS